MKLIVTHTNPDLDAVAATWLIKQFWQGWEEAEVKFVPAGETYQPQRFPNLTARADQLGDFEIIHVDTGLGEFDHHQTDEDTCSAKLVLGQMVKNSKFEIRNSKQIRNPKHKIPNESQFSQSKMQNFNKEALERLVAVVNDIDHFRNVYYPESTADYHDFSLVSILDGLNLLYNNKGEGDRQVVEHGLIALDGIYKILVNKVKAEKEVRDQKSEIRSQKWGRVIGFETGNDAVLELAQKMGYQVVIRKDPKKGYVRIKALPDAGIDLTPLYERLKKKDPKATWFLHISKTMLLNGTVKNPKMKPTRLGLGEIMKVIKEVKS